MIVWYLNSEESITLNLPCIPNCWEKESPTFLVILLKMVHLLPDIEGVQEKFGVAAMQGTAQVLIMF